MNVGELLDQLEECNEEATVNCIMQSENDASFYHTIAIGTETGAQVVNIILMNIMGEGISVKELKNELNAYEATLPVSVRINRLNPIQFPYEVNGILNRGDIAYLELPQLIGNLYEE
ncbi:MAG: hypothetical protein GF316_00275 [Candidatus Lokiarchaeota archaeon]|nr:hypothetical protein [Candidatus Lokiarchaeota archaeon]